MTAAVLDRVRPALFVFAAIAVAVAAGVLVTSPADVRIAIALGISFLAGTVAVRAPRAVLYALPVWLVALGTLRRITTGLVDVSAAADAFLIVGPAALVLLGVTAVSSGALGRRTPLTTATVGLIGVLGLSAFNPKQGGLMVGLAGAAAVVAPMLSFLVGRSLVTDQTLARLFALIAILAVPAAVYGLFQTFVRFPSWDQDWIDTLGYTALNVNGAVRPFGSFASGQEFGTFVAIGLIIALTYARRLRWFWAVPVLGILAAAVWYESARGLVVLAVAAVGAVLCARARWPIWRAIAVGIVLLASLPWLSARLAPDRFGDDAGSALTSHQVDGLVDPLGEDSTLRAHIDLALSGIRSAFRDPPGTGVGVTTGAAAKFAGTEGRTTEVDIGNVAVAGGLPGLVLFLAVSLLGLTTAYRCAISRADPIAVAAVGILIVTSLQWLNGGMYSVIWLPWLVLGWVDRPAGLAAEQRSKSGVRSRVELRP